MNIIVLDNREANSSKNHSRKRCLNFKHCLTKVNDSI